MQLDILGKYLSGNLLVDGVFLFSLTLLLYFWSRRIIVYFLFHAGFFYEELKEEEWDMNQTHQAARNIVSRFFLLMLCFEIAAFLTVGRCS